MKNYIKIGVLLFLLIITSCSDNMVFSGYKREVFPVTQITESTTKTVQILNESDSEVSHIPNVAFYANSNSDGHFMVTQARVGTQVVGLEDIFIPPLGVLNLDVTYAPLNFDTTEASFGGWITTSADRGMLPPEEDSEEKQEGTAVSAMSEMMTVKGAKESGSDIDYDNAAIHRAVLSVMFDSPSVGYSNIELVGGAVPGPNGEVEAVGVGGGGGECSAGGTTACFRGTFSINLPGLMSGGAMEVPMSGPVILKVDGSAAEMNMDEFPPVLIVLKGNGPGEPLEGKPVDAISIVISGTEGTLGVGTFDGRNLEMTGAAFRIRVLLGEITEDDITPGLAAAVDFDIPELEMTTEEPFDGGKIVFGIDTNLPPNPSGNGLFDSFLGGVRVVVKFSGALELP